MNDQIVFVAITWGSQILWILSAIYASPKERHRKELWDYIINTRQCISVPWLLLGDFNQVLSERDKSRGFSS